MSELKGEGDVRTKKAIRPLWVFLALLVVFISLPAYTVYRALQTGWIGIGHGESLSVSESPVFYWIMVSCFIFMIPATFYPIYRYWIHVRELKSGEAALKPLEPQSDPAANWVAYLVRPQTYKSRSTRIALAVLLFTPASLFPLLVADLTGHPFLLSAEWITSSWPFRIFFGAINVVAIYEILKAAKIPMNGYRTKLSILFAYAVACLIGMNTISGVTMIYVAVTGSETELRFTVVDPNASSRRCSYGVRVTWLWVIPNRLCGFPLSIKRSLQPGDPITVIGRGTTLGIFAREVRIEGR